MSKKEELELRCYVFVNKALSSIQKGVQGTHAIVEMLKKYQYATCPGFTFVKNWQDEYKTLIFLDGGFHQELLDNYKIFSSLCERLYFPYAIFKEDEETMNEMVTAFAGIIPETVYNLNIEEYMEIERYKLANETNSMGSYEVVKLNEFIKNFNLAI